jgi:hypothetical protein
MKGKGLANLIKYTMTMNAEFSTLTIRDALTIETVRNNMLKIPEWVEWSNKHGKYIVN